jgi:hypothetical protein
MPAAVAPAHRGHNVLSHTFRSRSRAASEVGPQPPPQGRPEAPKLPKAASYTYFPRVKDLQQEPPVVDLRGSISEDDLNNGGITARTSDSSRGTSPSSEDAPETDAVHMPPLRPKIASRRSSRFLSFSSRSRDPSVDSKSSRKPEKSRTEAMTKAESPGGSPARSLTKLRRKSWIVTGQQQQQQRSASSPTRGRLSEQTKNSTKRSQTPADAKRKTTIPEDSEARDVTPELHHVPLGKKNKRISGFFNATNAPPVPPLPNLKSFSTDRLPLHTHFPTPLSPNSVPPLPRNISAEKLRGTKTEPRKKDELWTVFRTLDGDLRKSVGHH